MLKNATQCRLRFKSERKAVLPEISATGHRERASRPALVPLRTIWQWVRPQGTIPRPIHAFCAEAFDRLGDSLRPVLKWRAPGASLSLPTINSPTHHGLSTFRGQRSILEGVHSVLGESLVFGDFRVSGLGRIDNILKVHV